MQNFTFQNPTKIIFGEGQIAALDAHVPRNARVLISSAGGSITRNGVLAQVQAALGERASFVFSGIEPNPTYETLMQAVTLAREKNIDFLLAVGGGSVIDGTKFIAAAMNFDGEPWDILAKQAPVRDAVPFGSVLTLPATGSEMNNGSVISYRAKGDKLFFTSDATYPLFSVLNPTTTYSLPPRQIANGVVDAFVHIVEQYLTYQVDAKVQDRFAEGHRASCPADVELLPAPTHAPIDLSVVGRWACIVILFCIANRRCSSIGVAASRVPRWCSGKLLVLQLDIGIRRPALCR
jgi:NADP-dependent alcohol dehydrogenase